MTKKNKDLFFKAYLKCLTKIIKERPKFSKKNTKIIGVTFKNSEKKHLDGATFQGRCKIYKNVKKKGSEYCFINNNVLYVPHGNMGIIKFSDGHIYNGAWKDGFFFDTGSYINPKEGEYYGMWNKGYMNGWGEYEYKNGNKYMGEFKNSRWNGLGTLKNDKGEIFRGYFKDNFELKKNGLIENYIIQEGEESYTYK